MNTFKKSESIKAGLRLGFQDGSSKMARHKCYGYTVGSDDKPTVNPDEAKVVCWIFERYLAGDSLGKIAAGLEQQGIPSPTGRPKWNREAIDKLLSNEKYTGRVLLQKTISTGISQIENNGLIDRYLYTDAHEAIISDEIFIAVQHVKLRGLLMRNAIEILAELRHLRVAAYCRVSTELEEQTSSIELQERYYTQLISENPNWENAGIFSERITGLNLKVRTEFHRILSKCRKKKVDLILTKSISQFGRNTLDMLQSMQELRSLGVDVYFEQENMHLNHQYLQMLLSAYCALAQAESENMSRNIKWGIKRGFENGTSGYAEFVCFDYKRGDNGSLIIDEANAKIGRHNLGSIADWLFENQIPHLPEKPAGAERQSANCCRMKNIRVMFYFRKLL